MLRSKPWRSLLGLACFLWATAAVCAQGTLFLHVDNITGPSVDPDHLGWTDAAMMNFGVSRVVSSVPSSGGASRAVGQAAFSEITVVRPVDAASVSLAREAAIGESQDVELEFVRSQMDRRRYYRLRLANAMVSSYSQHAGSSFSTETVAFNFTRLDMTYTDYLSEGSQVSTAWYDVVTLDSGTASGPVVNSPPVVSSFPDTNTLVNTPITLPFTASDPEHGKLTFSALSSNPTVLPVSRITFGGSGVSRTLLLSPATNQAGVSYVSVRVTDGVNTTLRSFNLSVTPTGGGGSNDAPAFFVSDSSPMSAIAGRPMPVQRVRIQDSVPADPIVLNVASHSPGASLNMAPAAGLSISNNGGAAVRITGSLAALNAMLTSTNGLVYRSAAGLSGTDILDFSMRDSSAGAPPIEMSLGVRIFLSQFQQWQYEKFTPSDLQDPARESTLWGPNADPDHDGLANLAEYALGTEPQSANRPGLSAGLISVGTNKFLSLQIMRRRDPDLQVLAAVSGEITGTNWTSDPADVESSQPVDLGNGFDRTVYTDRTPVGPETRRFMRLQWTLSPGTAR